MTTPKEDLKLEIRKYGIPAIRTMRDTHCEVVNQLLARAVDRIEELENIVHYSIYPKSAQRCKHENKAETNQWKDFVKMPWEAHDTPHPPRFKCFDCGSDILKSGVTVKDGRVIKNAQWRLLTIRR